MNDIIINYIKEAEESLSRFSNYKQLIKEGNIQIDEVNKALADYFCVSKFIIAEYEKKALAYDLLKAEFDQWYAEKYIEIKNELNPINLSAQKWASAREIDAYIQYRNKQEYKEKNECILLLNREVATLRRLCDSYKRMDNIFQTLSNNYRSDQKNESLINRMNNNDDFYNQRQRKIKKE